jgi:hypothetical protein
MAKHQLIACMFIGSYESRADGSPVMLRDSNPVIRQQMEKGV